MVYWLDFGNGKLEKGVDSLSKTRSMAISFMDFKQKTIYADFRPKVCKIYASQNKNSYVGKISCKMDRFWWVTYDSIQELNVNGTTKKLLTYTFGL